MCHTCPTYYESTWHMNAKCSIEKYCQLRRYTLIHCSCPSAFRQRVCKISTCYMTALHKKMHLPLSMLAVVSAEWPQHFTLYFKQTMTKQFGYRLQRVRRKLKGTSKTKYKFGLSKGPRCLNDNSTNFIASSTQTMAISMEPDEAAAPHQPLSGGVSVALQNLAFEIGGRQPNLPPQNMTGRLQWSL